VAKREARAAGLRAGERWSGGKGQTATAIWGVFLGDECGVQQNLGGEVVISRPGARGMWPGWWSAGIGVVHVEAWWTLRWLEGRIRC
jgi:hypothetical protein